MDEITPTVKIPTVSDLDIFCLRAYVIDGRTMESIGGELRVTRQRIKARLNRFGVKRGGAVMHDFARGYLIERIVPETPPLVTFFAAHEPGGDGYERPFSD